MAFLLDLADVDKARAVAERFGRNLGTTVVNIVLNNVIGYTKFG